MDPQPWVQKLLSPPARIGAKTRRFATTLRTAAEVTRRDECGTTLTMGRTVTVRAGDCLASLAAQHGFFNWRHIYDDPENDALREERPSPNHLLEGDRVAIPSKPEKRLPAATGQRHRFVVNRQPTKLRLRLAGLQPVRYRLTVGERSHQGSGDLVEHTIAPDAESALLEVWLEGDEEEPRLSFSLALGHVPPFDEQAGIQARLHNLGYRSASVAESVRTFQRSHGLAPTGEADRELAERLREAHDVG